MKNKIRYVHATVKVTCYNVMIDGKTEFSNYEA